MNPSKRVDRPMNPSQPPVTSVHPITVSPSALATPLPANFSQWPKPMRDRYRRHALHPLS